MQQFGLIAVASEADLQAAEQEQVRLEDEARRKERIESSLAATVRRRWETARRHKRHAEDRIMRNLRQRNGEYDPDKLAIIREQGAPEIYMMLTAVKCRAAKSWIRDVLMGGDPPWTLSPTPVSDLPEEMMAGLRQRMMVEAQKIMAMGGTFDPGALAEVEARLIKRLRGVIQDRAKSAAERLERKVHDKLLEGRWASEFEAFISDVVDFPAGIIKGPLQRRRRRMTWQDGRAQIIDEIVEEVERVDPLDFYPAPGITEVDDGDVFQRHRLTRSQLYDMIGVEGYNEEAIRQALQDYARGGLQDWETSSIESERARANDQETSTFDDDRIVAIEAWMEIPGRELIEEGVEGVDDPDRDYAVCVWLVGPHVIYAGLNPDPLGRKPYDKASFENVPGSFWGRGAPDLIRDCQDVCNAAARATVVNMGLASGPQVAIDAGSIPPGEDITSIYPWKIWQLAFKNGETRMPIQFYQPNPMVDALLKVYEHFSRLADEHSGIPAYTYGGTDLSGAGRTASGLSMLMNAASKAIKDVIAHIDGAVSCLVLRFAENVMLYEPSPEWSGDIRVVARGAMSLIAREQAQLRRIEFLGQTANPIDMQIMGIEGRAEVLREVAKSLEITADDIVPDRDTLLARQQMLIEQQAAQQQDEAREQALDGSVAGGVEARTV